MERTGRARGTDPSSRVLMDTLTPLAFAKLTLWSLTRVISLTVSLFRREKEAVLEIE